MFRFSAEVFILLAVTNPLICCDAFVVSPLRQQQRYSRQQSAAAIQRHNFQLHANSSPHPPGTPPPEAFFDNSDGSEDVDEDDEDVIEEWQEEEIAAEAEAAVEEEKKEVAAKSEPEAEPTPSPPPPEPYIEPEPVFSEEDLQRMQQFGSDLGNKAMESIIVSAGFWTRVFEHSTAYICFSLCSPQKPLVDIQKGVGPDRIKGAALTGAVLGLLASKGIVVSSAASLSAAYLAISRGVAGDVVRTVGGIAWDVTDAAARLLSIVANNEKLSLLPKGLAQKTVEALKSTQESARDLQMADSDDTVEAEQAFLDSQEDLTRVLEEAEAVIEEADEAIATAQALEEKLVEEDVDVSIPYDAAAELAYAESNPSVSFEDFKTKYNADAVNLVKAKQAERNRERDEAARILAEGAEAARRESQEGVEEEYGMNEMDEEDFLTAIEMAQDGFEGKIVGVDEAISDITGKEQWDAAGSLARELRQNEEVDGEEEYDDESDDDLLFMDEDEFEELDMEALGKAAREAVEMFDEEKVSPGQAAHAFEEASAAWSSMTVAQLREELKGRGLPTGGKKADLIARIAADDAVGDEDDEDYFADDEDDNEDFVMDRLDGLDMEALGKAAREAVQVSFLGEDDEEEDEYMYWSSKTVSELKNELSNRGLPVSGKKADLVQRVIEATDEDENEDEVEFEADISGFDLEALGRQAREAVQMFQSGGGDFDEEPTEEMLAQLENEMEMNSAFTDDLSPDFSEMTVAQLKQECKSRGLKVGGKKAELIERLQEVA